MESAMGLRKKQTDGLTIAADDFVNIRKKIIERSSKMTKEDLNEMHRLFEMQMERMTKLTFKVGYTTTRIIDLEVLNPTDRAIKLMSIFINEKSLRTNITAINDVLNYFSNILASLDKEGLQNKNGSCYRLVRLFVLFMIVKYPMGSSVVSLFLLSNVKSEGMK